MILQSRGDVEVFMLIEEPFTGENVARSVRLGQQLKQQFGHVGVLSGEETGCY